MKFPNTRVSDPFPVTFPGGKFWYHDKKKLAHFWARREARFAICPFFYEKNIFSAVEGADSVVVLTEWEEYSSINWEEVSKKMRKPGWVFDTRNIVDQLKVEKSGLNLWVVGKNY